MGYYLNPGNSGFERILSSAYVDKTGLIRHINEAIDTTHNLICVSRPRRFGKSFAAQMLCAYYGKECDSHELFDGLEITRDRSYEKHLNHYDVIYLDMTNILGNTDKEELILFLTDNLNQEVVRTYPDVAVGNTLDQTLINLTNHTGNKLVMIIDEWDAPIRETPEIEKAYLSFLRMLFKGSGTTSRIFAAVYMTGILPIKKDDSQSAISDFEEYTMVKPRHFAEFVGFTEDEVRRLCEEGDISFDRMKQWYDGYHFKTIDSAYNPNSVMKAIRYHDFDSYWSQTSAAEGLMRYISQDYSGLTKTIAELIGGVDVPVNTTGFSNDLTTFRGKDDVLTLLIHLGYLAYDSEKGTARIPNEEIRMEFQRSIREVRHKGTRERLRIWTVQSYLWGLVMIEMACLARKDTHAG